ncbi:hypothetical protein B0G62_12938 [Paraburkholderia eburnea]|uniref:Uncharacterized protein n=1 Tax=Paraburkholderia eburnea TaxID=1189126 RepID=A0A2S4LTM4_9BURK|nr:hypothetical protein [Paraburkholderia eburnea]POR45813.1 hypothetical protein B0G62_12938 [Paraburkholderia eburnea]PRZ14670.1 hypothetical protein BX588_12738 [Paraburkholderia eburnea]
MPQATRFRSRRNTTIVSIFCAALIVITFVLAEMKPWSRKPADAGLCQNNPAQWRQTALQNKTGGTAFAIPSGARWDEESRRWVVPFRTRDQQAGDPNQTALIDCTGAVTIPNTRGG